jgi:hypothetical protein
VAARSRTPFLLSNECLAQKPKFPEGKLKTREGICSVVQSGLQECGHRVGSSKMLEFSGYLKARGKNGRNQKCKLFRGEMKKV